VNFDIRFSPSGAKPLEVTLATMERTQLVRANEDLEHTFSFKHALVQESAYGSLIKHDRQRLHRLVGEALERVYPEALDENAALLAHHFENAQVPDRALFYLQRAAERARRANAHREQIALLTRALALAERSGTP
jgi:predicted ATPase